MSNANMNHSLAVVDYSDISIVRNVALPKSNVGPDNQLLLIQAQILITQSGTTPEDAKFQVCDVLVGSSNEDIEDCKIVVIKKQNSNESVFLSDNEETKLIAFIDNALKTNSDIVKTEKVINASQFIRNTHDRFLRNVAEM